jgi:hypothetical protein
VKIHERRGFQAVWKSRAYAPDRVKIRFD